VDVPRSQFLVDLTEAFISAGIAWNKLNNTKLRSFLKAYTNRSIPDEPTLRKSYLKDVYAKVR
jgi:hypothetical protein